MGFNLAFEGLKIIVKLGRPQMTIWRMRIACWLPEATNTRSEHVILTAFPLRRWLHERAWKLRCKCIGSLLVVVSTCGFLCDKPTNTRLWTCSVSYYSSPTCFGLSCDNHQGGFCVYFLIEFSNCPTRCDLFSLLHFCRQPYMFRVLTPSIRSSYNCNYSFWYWLTAMNKILCYWYWYII